MSRRKISKREQNAYKNYVKRYKEAEKKMRKRGREMYSEKLSKRDYLNIRKELVDNGLKTNINQSIVSEQQYQYSQKIARRIKKAAEDKDLSWKETSISDLRSGKGVDLSELNEQLKKEFSEMTSYDRAKWIGQEVFGSD